MERLTADDAVMLWPDARWPQEIGALAILDGAHLIEADGRLRVDVVRSAIASRLHLVPRFRQLLSVPRWGRGGPLWTDAPAFDLDQHLRVVPLIVSLPVDQSDPQRRLALIASRTSTLKRSDHPAVGVMLNNRIVRRVLLTFLARNPVNVTSADLIGPAEPVYLAGARLLEVFPVLPLMGNVTLGVGALSYAGQFNVAVVADRDTYPDLDIFVKGLREDLAELAALPSISGQTGRGRVA